MVEHLTFNSDNSNPSFKVLRLGFANFSSLLTAEKFGTYRIDLFHNGGLIIITEADPDLQMGGGGGEGGSSTPRDKGEDRTQKMFFDPSGLSLI